MVVDLAQRPEVQKKVLSLKFVIIYVLAFTVPNHPLKSYYVKRSISQCNLCRRQTLRADTEPQRPSAGLWIVGLRRKRSREHCEVIRKATTEIKYHRFKLFGPISVTSYLSGLKLSCSINGIYEGAAICLFHFFMNGSSAAALSARLCLQLASSSYTPTTLWGLLRNYQKAVNYFPQTWATAEPIAETNATLKQYIQPSTMSPPQYAEALVTKPPRCEKSWDKYIMKGVFIEGFHESVRHSINSYWSVHAGALYYDLARLATYLRAQQKGTEASSDKGYDHSRNSRQRGGSPGNTPDRVDVFNQTGENVPKQSEQCQ